MCAQRRELQYYAIVNSIAQTYGIRARCNVKNIEAIVGLGFAGISGAAVFGISAPAARVPHKIDRYSWVVGGPETTTSFSAKETIRC